MVFPNLFQEQRQDRNFTPVAWGDGGIGPCGGYCNDIDPTKRGDCARDRRVCYGNPEVPYETGHCMCCLDRVCQ